MWETPASKEVRSAEKEGCSAEKEGCKEEKGRPEKEGCKKEKRLTMARPEIDLLLACSRAKLNPSDRRRVVKTLDVDLNWEWLLRTAKRHAVLPLVSHHLMEYVDRIPSKWYGELRAFRRQNTASSLRLATETARLAQSFANCGVAAIAFKGAALSLTLYGNPGLRQYGDIDVLVRIADLERAVETMQSVGYQLAMTPAQQKYFRDRRYHFVFEHKTSGLFVEVHWAFTPRYWPFALDQQDLWQCRRFVTFHGRSIPCLSPEHSLLALCAHGAKERWARLQMLVDVCELVHNADIRWEKVLKEIDQTKQQRVLFLGLMLAEKVLEARLPDDVRQRCHQDKTAGRLVSTLSKQMFHPRWPLRGPTLHCYFLRVWPQWKSRTGYLRDYVRRLPDRLFPLITPAPHDRQSFRLPWFLGSLYYVVRPIRLAWRYRNPCRLFRRLLDQF
jgi:hypothetical protein